VNVRSRVQHVDVWSGTDNDDGKPSGNYVGRSPESRRPNVAGAEHGRTRDQYATSGEHGRGRCSQSRWWRIDSLYRFNAKFQPERRPRFICFLSMRDMHRIALAVLEAEAFIVRPLRLKRLLGRA
jgi:hypothetical protein